MSKLKKLSKEDLNEISNYFAEILDKELSVNIKFKEIVDLDFDIIIFYENSELNVDVDIDLDLDGLSDFDATNLENGIDNSYIQLDEFIDKNYRE
jgi:hypothetical protein